MVDITKFFIINQEQFQSIIDYLGCDLTVFDKSYLASYIIANAFGYFVILISLYFIFKIYYKLFAKRKGML